MTMTVGSLFSGIGGLDLGLERAGMRVLWQVENNPYASRVLAKHWPDVTRYSDIKELDPHDLEPVDLVAGGFPCQPVSAVGQRLSQDDARWLWPEFLRVVRGVRPRFVIVENVTGLFDRGFDVVLADLATLGFDAEWSVLSACAVGAPHPRERVFIVAHTPGERRERGRVTAHQGPPYVAGEGLRDRDRRHWTVEPRPDGVAYGVPYRVERLTGQGNAVVPQVAEWIGHHLLEVTA